MIKAIPSIAGIKKFKTQKTTEQINMRLPGYYYGKKKNKPGLNSQHFLCISFS
jgi:hypothetical protein